MNFCQMSKYFDSLLQNDSLLLSNITYNDFIGWLIKILPFDWLRRIIVNFIGLNIYNLGDT